MAFLFRKNLEGREIQWNHTTGEHRAPLGLTLGGIVSNIIPTPPTILSQEEALWLLSILDDEDWREGPVSKQEAIWSASGLPDEDPA